MIIFFSRLVLPLDGFRKSQLRLTSWLGNCAGESCSHLFFSCSMARNITTKLARWWEFDCPDLFSYDDWLEWFHTLRLLKCFKNILEGVPWLLGLGANAEALNKYNQLIDGCEAAGSLDEVIEVHEAYLLSIQHLCFVVPDTLIVYGILKLCLVV
ncbi:hypothetical protein Tco_0676945 [Tanacetum coccineum]